jgi:uncharacterized protein (DUF58 family)
VIRPEDPFERPTLPLAAIGAAAAWYAVRAGSAPAAALAIALLTLLAAAWLYARLGAGSAHATRTIARRAFEDERIEVRFDVESRGALPLVGLEVEDVFPADRAPQKRAVIFPALRAYHRVSARYFADCDAKRGLYAVGPVSVVARDPLGIVRARRELGGLANLLVYPHVFPIARLPRAGGGTRYDASAALGGLAGAGIDFLGTREYRPGDPLRLVHWGSTARTGRLVVKELEETAAEDVAVFLDLSRLAVRGIGRISTLEYAIRIAASVATHVARGANRVRIFGRGKKPIDIPPGSGAAHVTSILETLALARADGETPLAELLRETASQLGKGATAVVIFSSLEVDLREHAEVLALYRGRGVRFIAVLIDARMFLKLYDEQISLEREAPGPGAIVEALLGEGAVVYTVARNEDLARRFDAPILPVGGPP